MLMGENNNQIVLDIRGQICPSCLLIALKEVTNNIDKISSGDLTLLIISDDRHATSTIPDSVKAMGLEAAVEKSDKGYEILISRE